MTELSDHELLAQYAHAESEAAFATLVARYVNLVYSAALRFTGNPHHAEEITQAVFIILARKAGSLRTGTVLSGWLYQTARLTAANFVKSEIRRQRREQETYMQSTLNEPDAAAWEQIAPLLDEAMGRLGETDRNAVVLRFFENKTAREVGATLKLNEAAAHKRVSRAVEKLRRFFRKRGVTLSATAIASLVAVNSVQAAPVGLAVTISATAAKGAAVAASITTLVQGTINIMTWIKLKIASLVGATVLVASGAILWEADSRILEKEPPVLIIQPTKFAGRAGGIDAGDRAMWKNASISTLLSIAYEFPEARLVLPNNLSKKRFDLMLTLPDHPKEALKAEIKKRFGLVGHPQALVTNVLSLKVRNTNAPGLIPIHGARAATYAADPAVPWSRPPGSGGRWMGYPNTTLVNFVIDLEFKLKEMVHDQTGLTGHFEIQLRWQAKGGETENDAFKRAVLEQLGLELVPSHEPIEMLVVEKVK